jgi:hypothetical protein
MERERFKVGDIITYIGYEIRGENDRPQIITGVYNFYGYDEYHSTFIDNNEYHSTFIDNNETNEFSYSSNYFKQCVLVEKNGDSLIFDNGIPLVWEDMI